MSRVSLNIHFRSIPKSNQLFMNFVCRENSRKHPPPKSMCHEPHVSMEKSQSFMQGNILYPHPSNDQSLQQELNKENRLLWATLTPHGTRHFIATESTEPYTTNYEDHYEVVDYHNKPTLKTRETRLHEPMKKFPNKVRIQMIRTCSRE